ncbi:hypothetical protein AB0D94_34025 [Streptomyces sp. NPDC048255]|uniref:hypothetical protein n=1 Tax=Streptomyces sp. NPDC048255 TaxID=3154713 RepID=UPI0033C2CB3F
MGVRDLVPEAGDRERPAPRGPDSAALGWTAGAAGVFALVQLLLVAPGTGLGWDEIVYISQVQSGTPTAFFSAPRARGISYLVAPVALLTASTAVLRAYLALLSATGLFLALWVWRRLLPPAVLGAAGLLFAGLWTTLYYGPRAMPNLWCALGALAATGWLLRALRPGGGRAALLATGAAVAFVTVMRPVDGVWLSLPLVAAALVFAGGRRLRVAAAPVAGVALGALPWVAEAYGSYGGLAARLARASEIQGGLGWHVAVDDQVRSLVGRTLCRPCEGPWTHPWTAAWWFALPLLAAGGVVLARRAGRGRSAAVAAGVGLCLALPYLFSVDYAAPRFLLPAYAVLSVPVAECVAGCFAAVRARALAPGRRRAAYGVLAGALFVHTAVQGAVLHRVDERSRNQHRVLTATGHALHRLGVRPPCVVSGEQAIPIAYYAGCASRQVGGHDASISAERLAVLGRSRPVAVISAGRARPPSFARSWPASPLPGGYVAWLAPRSR